MAVKPKPLMETIIGEAVRNWVIDTAVDHFMPTLKFVDDESKVVLRYRDPISGEEIRIIDPVTGREIRLEYVEAIYWLRHNPKESRALIISAGQGVYSVMARLPVKKVVPLDKFPGAEKALDFIFEQTGETLEQLPDSLRAYAAHEDHLPYPDGFKPREIKEVITGLVVSLKGAVESAGENFTNTLKGRLPAFRKFVPKKFGGDKETGVDHLKALELKPALLKRWLEFVSALPADAEDDLRRIDAALQPGLIRSLLKMDRAQAVQTIRRLAKDSFEENLDAAVADVVKPINGVLDRWQAGLRDRLAKFDGPGITDSTEPRVESISIRSYERIRQPDLDEVIRFGR